MRSAKFFGAYLLVFVAFYILVCFNTFQCDDLRFAMSVDGGRVTGWLDAIKAQYPEYLTWSGRFLVQVLGRYTAGVLGEDVARVISSCFFSVLCFLMLKLARQDYQLMLLPVIGVMFLLFLPNIDGTFIGNLVGAVNYLWTAVFNLAFLLWVNAVIKAEKLHLVNFVSFLVCALIGSLQESFSIGVAASLFFYWCCNHRSVTGSFKVASLGYWLGSAFLVFGPGNFGRLALTTDHSNGFILSLFIRFASVMVSLRITWLLVVALLILRKKEGKVLSGFVRDNVLLLVPIVVNMLFCVFVAFAGAHQLTCIEILSAILLLRMIMSDGLFVERYLRKVSLISLGMIILLYIPILNARSDAHSAYEEMMENAYASTDGVLVSDRFDSISYSETGYFYDRFVQTELNANTPLDALSRYVTNSTDTTFLKTNLPKPQSVIISQCSSENLLSEGIYYPGTYYYIIRIPTRASYTQLVVSQSNSLLGKIKNLLFGVEDYDNAVSVVPLEGLDCFACSGYTYYIHRFLKEYKVNHLSLN